LIFQLSNFFVALQLSVRVVFCCPKYASFLGDLEAFAVYLRIYHFDPAPSIRRTKLTIDKF
ncbi:hypothetical protein, partial [Lacticaseibacillus rhamnosus]|uniref:hypothetical protein n=1 Tax=Lacticaseibacillus rhamnosus TaxID=47715 RepID=UPI000665FD0B